MRRHSPLFASGRGRIALLAAGTLLVGQQAAVVRAGNVEITSAVAGTQYGQGGTFTITSTGSVTDSGGSAVVSQSGNEITAFANDGSVGAYNAALFNNATAMTSFANSGTMTGDSGIYTTGTIGTATNAAGATISANSYGVIVDGAGSSIGTLTNSGAITNTGGGKGIQISGGGSIGTLTNDATGTITGGFNDGVLVYQASLGSLSNAGSITGPDFGVYTVSITSPLASLANSGSIEGGSGGVRNESSTITAIANTAGGTIKGTGNDGIQNLDAIGSITNAGTIEGVGRAGIQNEDYFKAAAIGSITNDAGGLIKGPVGINNDGRYGNGATTTTITNASGGTIQGTAFDGIQNVGGGITTIDNTGTIQADGRNGITNVDYGGSATIGQITNRAGGTISGAANGILNEQSWGNVASIAAITNLGSITGSNAGIVNFQAATGTISNAGSISGDVGIQNTFAGTITLLTNSGTITGTLAGAPRAVANAGTITQLANTGTLGDIGNDGMIGDGTGTALSSTGAGASIGTIHNTTGIIDGDVIVDGQNLTIVGGGGDLYVTNEVGSLAGGTITVGNGSLTLQGNTILQSDVVVSSAAGVAGAGTMTNEGTLALVDARALTGDLVLDAAGRFLSLNSGLTQYGSLAVSGSVDFDGVLDIFDLAQPLVGGQTLDLLSFASRVGTSQFVGITANGAPLASLGGGVWAYGSLLLTEVWTGTSFSLDVTTTVPEIDPAGLGSILALLAGVAGLLERRRPAGRATP
ncbi:MAG: beta strand repeat-containing protein [Planctomycetaceae bacterium]